MEFQEEEVGHSGQDMASGHHAQRRGDIVRRDRDIMRVSQVSDALSFGNAAGFRQIGHDHITSAFRE